MDEQYWLQRDGKTMGPFPAPQLRQMAAAGMVMGSDLISADQVTWTAGKGLTGLLGPGEDDSVAQHASESDAQTVVVSNGIPDDGVSGRAEVTDDGSVAAPAETSRLPNQRPTCNLHEAVAHGDFEQIRLHLAWGTNINGKDDQGRTPLHIAAQKAGSSEEAIRLAIVEFLLANRADVNAPDDGGQTPLHVAAEGDNVRLVEFLITMGANVCARTKYGGLPLSTVRNASIARTLMSHGGAFMDWDNFSDDRGMTPLHKQIFGGRPDVVRSILDHFKALAASNRSSVEFAVNRETDSGLTALDFAKQALSSAERGKSHPSQPQEWREVVLALQSLGGKCSPWWHKCRVWGWIKSVSFGAAALLFLAFLGGLRGLGTIIPLGLSIVVALVAEKESQPRKRELP